MSEIKLMEVDTEGVGSPRNDGTAGSGLYLVPIKLSETPSSTWARVFPDVWDRPPRWTTMHRPGIVSIRRDRILLDGTTIDEVRDVHAETLKLAVEETNRRVAEIKAREQAEADRRNRFEAEHQTNVKEISSEIRFD